MPVRVLSLFLSQGLLAVFHGRFLIDVLFFWRNKKLFQFIFDS